MNHARTPYQVAGPGRSGTILICVLACLAITTAIVTGTLRATLRAHIEVRKERLLRQAELVLEAGILRASQQLAADADYQGETWQLADQTIPGGSLTLVEITVDRTGDSAQVGVTSRLGDAPQKVQRSFEFTFDPITPTKQE